jgi:transcriptional regulator with XRE-family HTH domain
MTPHRKAITLLNAHGAAMDTIDWPRRLKALRKARGMTLAQMAEALGYSQGTYVANLESGRATITPMLERLIAAYEAGYVPRRDPDPSLHG